MKSTAIKFIWGIILVSLGGLVLAENLGYVGYGLYTTQMCTIAFAIISAAFILTYFLSGVRNWGWLFPALIFATLALTIARILRDDDNSILALPLLLSIAIPFYVGYILNRRHWGLLIPAWLMTVIAVMPVLAERNNPDLLGALFLFSTSLPFLIGYLVDQRHKLVHITGAILGFIGIFPLVNSFIHGDNQGPVVMLLFTLFFLMIYFVSNKNWWALIPSGVFASIGLVALLDSLLPSHDYFLIGNLNFGGYTSVLLLGFAVTFGILWLLRASQPTAWSKYPAICLLAASVLAFLMGKGFEDFLPVVVVLVVGVVMLAGALLKRRVTNQHTS